MNFSVLLNSLCTLCVCFMKSADWETLNLTLAFSATCVRHTTLIVHFFRSGLSSSGGKKPSPRKCVV